MKKFVALMLALSMTTTLAACSGASESSAPPTSSTPASTTPDSPAEPEHLEETITVLLPPIDAMLPGAFEELEAEFEKEYSWIDLDITMTSWDEYDNQLSIMVNAGTPPDITYPGVPITAIQQYLPTGMLLDISNHIDPETLGVYDEAALQFFYNNDALYGLPMVVTCQTLGGNQQYLEAAGIDWKKIQQEGWSFDEFTQAAAKGVKKTGDQTDVYGFVFACAGVASTDLIDLLCCSAGMPNAIDENGKYAYTDENFLKCLQFVRNLIDEGIMPKEISSVDAGMRWNMMLTGNTMLTGKGLPNFESLARKNNELLETDPAAAAVDSKHLDYVGMPVPYLEGCEFTTYGVVNGLVAFRQKEEPTPAHIENVVLAMNYIATSNQVTELMALGCQSPANTIGRAALPELLEAHDIVMNPDNMTFNENAGSRVYKPNTAITAEQADKATRIKSEVILPQMQALLAGEVTPEQMYETVREAAIEQFGEDGIR